MPEPGQPQQISHHLLLCATPTKALCCPDPAVGSTSWDTLKRLVRELGLEQPDRPEGIVLRTKADCLRICAEGPILLIWPEGSVYTGVTPERIERILREHVIGGTPIEAWIFRRMPFRAPLNPARSSAAASASAL
jgi:(2Fe-2S) ferredoxin